MERITLQKNQDSEPALARDILKYYLRNPQAADTLEGIARWRLMEQKVRDTVSEVQESINWLVDEGLLLKTLRFTSPPLFELNRDRIGDCRRFLEQAPQTDKGPET